MLSSFSKALQISTRRKGGADMATANEYTVYRIQAIKSDGTLGPLHLVALDQSDNREFKRKYLDNSARDPRVRNAIFEVSTLKEPS